MFRLKIRFVAVASTVFLATGLLGSGAGRPVAAAPGQSAGSPKPEEISHDDHVTVDGLTYAVSDINLSPTFYDRSEHTHTASGQYLVATITVTDSGSVTSTASDENLELVSGEKPYRPKSFSDTEDPALGAGILRAWNIVFDVPRKAAVADFDLRVRGDKPDHVKLIALP